MDERDNFKSYYSNHVLYLQRTSKDTVEIVGYGDERSRCYLPDKNILRCPRKDLERHVKSDALIVSSAILTDTLEKILGDYQHFRFVEDADVIITTDLYYDNATQHLHKITLVNTSNVIETIESFDRGVIYTAPDSVCFDYVQKIKISKTPICFNIE